MTFEEARDVVKGLTGRMVDVSVGVRDGEGELRSFADFSGTVREVKPGTMRNQSEVWRIWFEDTGPGPTCVTLEAGSYEGGDVQGSGASLEQVEAERAYEQGTNWTVTLRHFGVVTELLIYV